MHSGAVGHRGGRLGALLLASALVACGAPAPTSDRHPVTGSITLPDATQIDYLTEHDDARDCQGSGEFADLVANAQVIARDGAGAVVGTGHVEVGENAKEEVDNPSLLAEDRPPCVMPFSVGVQDADFYTFTIAGWPAELVYSREDLEAVDWTLQLEPTG